ncbi:MAG TPA: amidophosphoribosyltransferase [Thermoclostridium sp.]|nr:amidophosphoribosyltransferase [Thermoclostridium sp.]HPU45288.1 amidophosphoribosyltransferase [Thermoclostridium sp.]
MTENRTGTLHCSMDWDDKPREACGVFGVVNNNGFDIARMVYFGLYALQHRGQESCGIAVTDENGAITGHKGLGLVSEVFSDKILDRMEGRIAIGHCRYSTTGGTSIENSQPLMANYKNGPMAIAHNGNLVNAGKIRRTLEESGAIFQTSTDSEVIANLISRYGIQTGDLEEILSMIMEQVKGSYSLVLMTRNHLIGMRDPWGLRPLCIGKLDDSIILASESCALDAVGADFVRNVEPGEIVFIQGAEIRSIRKAVGSQPRHFCIFEHIYFARPDSFIDGASVYRARLEAGRRLAIEHPVDADLVVGVPDSGLTAAIGFSRQSGIPYGEALIKNRYVGRTFIQPQQRMREQSVDIKLNALREEIEGKRIVMIDDSIVRGTTTRKLVQMLKNAGAKEVHMRISSPPVRFPCYFGIDISCTNQLIAAQKTIEEIRESMGADSLGFLSVEGLMKTPVGACETGFCTGCFTGKYPIELGPEGFPVE